MACYDLERDQLKVVKADEAALKADPDNPQPTRYRHWFVHRDE